MRLNSVFLTLKNHHLKTLDVLVKQMDRTQAKVMASEVRNKSVKIGQTKVKLKKTVYLKTEPRISMNCRKEYNLLR